MATTTAATPTHKVHLTWLLCLLSPFIMVRTKGLPSALDDDASPPARQPIRTRTSSRKASICDRSITDSSTVATADIPPPPVLRSQEHAPALAPPSTASSTRGPRRRPPASTTNPPDASARTTRRPHQQQQQQSQQTRQQNRRPPQQQNRRPQGQQPQSESQSQATPTDETMSENQFEVKAFMASLGTQDNVNMSRTSPGAVRVQGINLPTNSSEWDNVIEPTGSDRDTEVSPPVLAAELATEESDIVLLAKHLERQITESFQAQLKQEVASQLTSQDQQRVVAEAVVANTSTSGDGTLKSSKHSDHDNFTVCGLRRRTWGYILLIFMILVGGAIAVVTLYWKSDEKQSAAAPTQSPTLRVSPSPISQNKLEEIQQELEPLIIRTEADLILLEDPSSPQSFALQWLSTDPISLVDNVATNIILERYALAVLYFSTDGPNWSLQGLEYMSESNTCDWNNGLLLNDENAIGIYCNGTSSVQYILLQQRGLSGTLPWELSLLFDLAYLNMDQNMLRGTIPTEFNNLSNLQGLWLHSNTLTGPLPINLPSSLRSIDFATNILTGRLPNAWGDNLSGLFWLSLSVNELTGPLPSSWQGLRSLQDLDLASNQLEGTISPLLVASWPSVASLFLETNNLSGPLPSELGLMTALKNMIIYENNLTGTIPTELAQLTNLESFSFAQNLFTGSVNETLCVSDFWTLLASDCLADSDGQAEIECSCCTACCAADGDRCEEYDSFVI